METEPKPQIHRTARCTQSRRRKHPLALESAPEAETKTFDATAPVGTKAMVFCQIQNSVYLRHALLGLCSVSMKNEISIRQFTDYRTFLIAHSQDMKRIRPEWSYGSWAKRLGLKATSSITKILHGEREPGDQITEQLVSYFQFDERDATYFRDLVRLNKIRKDPRLSLLLLEKMSKENPQVAYRFLDDKTFSVISNWYYLPLRELIGSPQFIEDAEWIVKQFRFKLTAREVTQAIETMLELNLIQRKEDGRLSLAAGRISTNNDVASEGIKRYHEQMLDHAKLALRNTEVAEREFTASSLSLRIESLEKAKEVIRDFRRHFADLIEETEGDTVYQLQIQLFPLTKAPVKASIIGSVIESTSGDAVSPIEAGAEPSNDASAIANAEISPSDSLSPAGE